jgi:hypothetical protein
VALFRTQICEPSVELFQGVRRPRVVVMKKYFSLLFIWAFLATFLLGCSDRQERAFFECQFELTKVLATRATNSEVQLDKLLKRAFVIECMRSKGQKLTPAQFETI